MAQHETDVGGTVGSEQDRILAILKRERMPLRVSEISRWAAVTPGKTKRILLRLVTEGIVYYGSPYYSLAQSGRGDTP